MIRRTFITGAATALIAAATRAASASAAATALESGAAKATDLADAIRRKRMTAREAVQAAAARIDRYNPELNAVVVDLRERAFARAKQADDALARGTTWGPLHGVPITIKEAFAYAGSPNTWGRPEFKGRNSARTAAAVERLEAAGAIVIGKTNIPTGLADVQSYNDIYGTTNNPWDVSRTAGGSTGGGAAATAAGLGAFTLGSDSGGSIRTPAHVCGVYGHKPTVNLVSMAGHVPGPWSGDAIEANRTGLRFGESLGRSFDFQVAGPLARDARDLALALRAMGGPVGDEALAWTWRLPPPRHARLRDFRVGYLIGPSPGATSDDVHILASGQRCRKEPLDSELHGMYENLLSALGRAGARLTRGWPEGIDFVSQSDMATYLGLARFNPGDEQMDRMRRRLETNPDDTIALAYAGPHSRWLMQTERQLSFRAAWQNYFKTHDLFLLPPACTVAFPHDHRPAGQRQIQGLDAVWTPTEFGYWSVFATVPGLPATVAPIGRTRAGLPVGIQIIAPMWEDASSIEFAALLTDLAGGFVPPPGYA